jgi:hypothetical protein
MCVHTPSRVRLSQAAEFKQTPSFFLKSFRCRFSSIHLRHGITAPQTPRKTSVCSVKTVLAEDEKERPHEALHAAEVSGIRYRYVTAANFWFFCMLVGHKYLGLNHLTVIGGYIVSIGG